MVVLRNILRNVAFYFSLWGLSCKSRPLELGFVTFPDTVKPKTSISFNATNVEITPEKTRRIFDHEWVPGKVRHHAFIPAHLHHIYLPIVFSKTVLVRSPYDLYQRSYGGYGIGTLTGGQGAGHGFQIVFHENID